VFDALHLEVLDRLGEQGGLDWMRASIDIMSVRARRGGSRGRKIQSIAASRDRNSTWSAMARPALTVVVTAANVNDSTMFEAVLDDILAVQTPSGRRRGGLTSSMRIRHTMPGTAASTFAGVG
jgi:hypothetical protein